MFQLTKEEFEGLRLQIETSNSRGGTRYLPYAFTEQAVAMLSGIAINMNLAIMRAFVEIRKTIIQENDLMEQLRQVKEILGSHDEQLKQTCLPAKAGLRCDGKPDG